MLNRPDFPADHPRFKTSKRVVCDVLHRPPHGRRTSWQTRNEPAPTLRVAQVDDEAVPFEPESFDLIVSSMSLHWTNDLPGTPSAPHSALGTSASTAPAFCRVWPNAPAGTALNSSARPARRLIFAFPLLQLTCGNAVRCPEASAQEPTTRWTLYRGNARRRHTLSGSRGHPSARCVAIRWSVSVRGRCAGWAQLHRLVGTGLVVRATRGSCSRRAGPDAGGMHR